MQISVKDAQENLSELLDRVESGEDVLLTRDGTIIARIVSMHPTKPADITQEERRAAAEGSRAMARLHDNPMQPSLEEIQERVRSKIDHFANTSAARSQDFLYDERGLPK